ncbi:MAG: hypothetical protein IIX11_05445, partial [Selenomonadales bacterium]|nr:hypothetical protein [Selenomonadales bacterium]
SPHDPADLASYSTAPHDPADLDRLKTGIKKTGQHTAACLFSFAVSFIGKCIALRKEVFCVSAMHK